MTAFSDHSHPVTIQHHNRTASSPNNYFTPGEKMKCGALGRKGILIKSKLAF